MARTLVTGANRGIGLALVETFAERGDHVVATARDASTVDALAALVSRFPDLVEVHALEVTDPTSIAALVARLDGRPLDVLVNNAGIIGPARQSSLDMDWVGWLDAFRINAMAPLAVAQAFLPALRKGDHARIMSISTAMSSMSSRASDRVAYRSSKAALNKVMQCLAADLRDDDIAVGVCHPGWVKTDMGGATADITPQMSAAGIVRLIDRMGIGRPFTLEVWDGGTVPW
jgi:NAD(P)-dependent dehydrogenase (short-subunit alcohol dehydrogenase family)